MNDLTVATGTTSMQIAETTGKQHCHIMRDIRDEIAKLGLGGINVESLFELVEYTDAKGEKRPCYQLSKEGVLQLAARYDAVVRAKLIELAMRQKKPFKKKISNEVIPMKTNSDRRNTSKRCQSTYQIKTSFRNSGRIAGMGILYDDYSEEAYPSVNTDPRYCPDPKLGIPLTEEEKKFRDEGGPVIAYQIKEDKQ